MFYKLVKHSVFYSVRAEGGQFIETGLFKQEIAGYSPIKQRHVDAITKACSSTKLSEQL